MNIGVGIDMRRLYRWIANMTHQSMCVIGDEFKVVFADGGALLLLGFATMIYTIIYSTAYGAEVVRDIPIVVVDDDKSPTSRALISGLDDGPDTWVAYEVANMKEAQELFFRDEVFGIVNIPDGLEADLLANRATEVTLILDGSHLLLYSHVLEQAVSDVLTTGAMVEAGRVVAGGGSGIEAVGIVSPVSMNVEMLFNPYLGYGAFVMPSILIVIIQQSMLIGIAMAALYRSRKRVVLACNPIISTLSKMLVYIVIYGFNLLVILGVVWHVFDLPYSADTLDMVLLLFIYMVATSALGLTLSHLFRRRESTIMLLLWTSIPILLLAGISYPREAFPEWMYDIGRILPSSSAVDAFIKLSSMGASLRDILPELFTLIVLALIYTFSAILSEFHIAKCKKIT